MSSLGEKVSDHGPRPEANEAGDPGYRALFLAMDEGLALCELVRDPQGRAIDYRILEVNRAFENHTGFAPAAVIGRLCSEANPVRDERFLDTAAKVVESGMPARLEQYDQSLDRWFRVGLFPFGGDKFAGLFDDITERKETEAALRGSEEKYRSLFNSMSEGFELFEVVRDESGRPYDVINLELNPAYERQTRIRPEDYVGKRWSEFGPSIEPYWYERVFKVAETGEPKAYEGYSSLQCRFFEASFFLYEKDRVGVLFRDATERKRAEETLASGLRDTSLLRDLSMRLIAEEDIHAFYQEIIDTAVVLAKADKGTLQIHEGGSLRIVSSHGHQQSFLDYFAKAEEVISASGNAAQRNERVVVPDVETSPLFIRTPSLQVLRDANVRAVQSTPLVSRNGELLGILTTHWNTPYDPNKKDLWRIDLLARQAADFIEHRRGEESLKRSNSDLQQFAYVASHDLQEPLRMVSSYLQLLERKDADKLDNKSKEYMNFAVDGAQRMSAMIEDLLAYSRVDTRGKPLALVNMDGVLTTVLKDLKVAIEESGCSVTSTALPTVMTNRSQMVLLLDNLIGNAIKFRSKAAPQILVSARWSDGEWLFSVQDNGIGIDPRFADRIFLMFQRLHTLDEYPGTGIGLTISKKIVEGHGGRIWFESELGRGSTFYFTIPAKNA